MDKFEDFFKHEETGVALTAGKLAQLENLMKKGELSKSEFAELANDLLEYDRIDELADDLERQIMYKKAFDVLKTIVSIATAV